MSFPDYQHRIADTKRQILVIGMTGRFGRIADLLLERGHAVRVATRDPALPAAARLAARGADITRADLEDTGTLAAAAKDADAAFAAAQRTRRGQPARRVTGRTSRRHSPWPARPTWSSSPGREPAGPPTCPCSRPSGRS